MSNAITEVTLFKKPKCVQCDSTVRAFDKRGLVEDVDYNIVDMSTDLQALEAVKAMGYMVAPVVRVTYEDGTVDHWGGMRPDKINEHFGSPQKAAA